MEEIWKDVEGYEDQYRVSNTGKIMSIRDRGKQRNLLLKPNTDKLGYQRIVLYKNGKRNDLLIHRIVALNFIEKIPYKDCVNHIDENKQNNNVNNLEWCDHRENNTHGTRIKRAFETVKHSEKWKQGIRNRVIKTRTSVTGVNLKTGETVKFNSMNDSASEGFSPGSISQCLSGKLKTHKGYKWSKQ